MRRGLLLGAAAAAMAITSRETAVAAHSGTTVGAIRWDAWYTGTDAGGIRGVEASILSPKQWQARAPACAKVISSQGINFDACGTQAQIDAEINAAHAAKIDYWAYCWFGPDHNMQHAWRLHQSSKVRNKINWCLLFSYSLFEAEISSMTSILVGYLKQPNYQREASGRPILYMLKNNNSATISVSMRSFRSACVDAGVANPYIVLLSSGPTRGAVAEVGADAIGTYEKAGPTPVAGAYSDLVRIAEDYWRTLAATGQPVVPTAMTGWDRRPRVDHPPPWDEAAHKTNTVNSPYFVAGAPLAIAAHIADMVQWIRANPDQCPAKTGLIYSWDEHDEGGSTLNPTVGNGDAILRAVGRVL
jgi:hypothetical protein